MTTRLTGVAVLAAVLLAVLVSPDPASAEGFADLYLGAAFTQSHDADVRLDGTKLTLTDRDFETSLLVGGRAGWWFGPFGLNLDISWYRPDPDDVTASDSTGLLIGEPFTFTTSANLEVVSIGINGMLRGQFLKDSQVPQGRLQPYVFLGPTLFVSTLDIRSSFSTPSLGTIRSDDSDTDVQLGLTAGGGVTYLFTKNVGAFAEYRFTHHSPEWHLNGLTVDTTLNTHHLLAGLTFRF